MKHSNPKVNKVLRRLAYHASQQTPSKWTIRLAYDDIVKELSPKEQGPSLYFYNMQILTARSEAKKLIEKVVGHKINV
jgi:hypothetical protein